MEDFKILTVLHYLSWHEIERYAGFIIASLAGVLLTESYITNLKYERHMSLEDQPAGFRFFFLGPASGNQLIRVVDHNFSALPCSNCYLSRRTGLVSGLKIFGAKH